MSQTRSRKRRWTSDEPDVFPADVLGALADLDLHIAFVRNDEAYIECPWHEDNLGRRDRRPGTFSVNLDNGGSWCFACQGGGPFIALVKQVTGMHGWDALGWILKQGIYLGVRERERAERVAPEYDPEAPPDISEANLAVYREPRIDLLLDRHIRPRAAEHFGILWDGREHCWILPIRDDRKELLGWQEKYLDGRTRNRPRGVERNKTLFGLNEFEGDTAVVVESPLDVARLWSAGIKGGLGTWGSYVSDEQVRLVISAAPRVVLAMDNPLIDDAGKLTLYGGKTKKGRTVRGLIDRLAPRCQVLLWNYADEEFKDPGEMDDEMCWAAYDTAIPSFMAVR